MWSRAAAILLFSAVALAGKRRTASAQVPTSPNDPYNTSRCTQAAEPTISECQDPNREVWTYVTYDPQTGLSNSAPLRTKAKAQQSREYWEHDCQVLQAQHIMGGCQKQFGGVFCAACGPGSGSSNGGASPGGVSGSSIWFTEARRLLSVWASQMQAALQTLQSAERNPFASVGAVTREYANELAQVQQRVRLLQGLEDRVTSGLDVTAAQIQQATQDLQTSMNDLSATGSRLTTDIADAQQRAQVDSQQAAAQQQALAQRQAAVNADRAAAQQYLQQWQAQLAQQQTQMLQSYDSSDEADVARERQRLRDGLASDAQVLETVNNQVAQASPDQMPGVLQSAADQLERQADQADRDAQSAEGMIGSASTLLNSLGRVLASSGSIGNTSASDAYQRKVDAANALRDAEQARAQRLRDAASQLQQQREALGARAPAQTAAPAAVYQPAPAPEAPGSGSEEGAGATARAPETVPGAIGLTIEKVSGDGQIIPTGAWQNFSVRVTIGGRPVEGAKVAWTTPSGDLSYVGVTAANGMTGATNLYSGATGDYEQVAAIVSQDTPTGLKRSATYNVIGPAVRFRFQQR